MWKFVLCVKIHATLGLCGLELLLALKAAQRISSGGMLGPGGPAVITSILERLRLRLVQLFFTNFCFEKPKANQRGKFSKQLLRICSFFLV